MTPSLTLVPSNIHRWVMDGGDDNAPGTEADPYATMQGAWDAILNTCVFGPPVGLAPGDYRGPIVHVGNKLWTKGVLCRGTLTRLSDLLLFEALAPDGSSRNCAIVPSVDSGLGINNCFYADGGARIGISGFFMSSPYGLGDLVGVGGGGSIAALMRKSSLHGAVATPGANPRFGVWTSASSAELYVGLGATWQNPYRYGVLGEGLPGVPMAAGGQYQFAAGDGGHINFCTNGDRGPGGEFIVQPYIYHTPHFTEGFACANGCGTINGEALGWMGDQISGSIIATGPVGQAKRNGVVGGGLGNPSYWPGTIAPMIVSGGRFEGWV